MAEIWVNHGNQIGDIYVGSGSVRSSFILYGRWNLFDKILDLLTLNQRWYTNHFWDINNQLAIGLISQSETNSTVEIEKKLKVVDDEANKRIFCVRNFGY